MYTSEIRETDPEGKPVTVSPALLARVRETDDALRSRFGTGFALEYAGHWNFPETDRALLTLEVRISGEPEAFPVSLPFNERTTESFVGDAVDTVLAQASKAIAARLRRRMHDLLVATPAE